MKQIVYLRQKQKGEISVRTYQDRYIPGIYHTGTLYAKRVAAETETDETAYCTQKKKTG